MVLKVCQELYWLSDQQGDCVGLKFTDPGIRHRLLCVPSKNIGDRIGILVADGNAVFSRFGEYRLVYIPLSDAVFGSEPAQEKLLRVTWHDAQMVPVTRIELPQSVVR